MKNNVVFSSIIKRYAWQEICSRNGKDFDTRNRCIAVPDENTMTSKEQSQLSDLIAQLMPEAKSKLQSAKECGAKIGTDLYCRLRGIRGIVVLRWEGEF